MKKLNIKNKKNKEVNNSLLANMKEAYAIHKIICDKKGKPVDYKFLDVNPAFEKLTRLSRDKIIGKRFLEIFPRSESNWINTYGKVAITGKPVHFEKYSKTLKRWYEFFAYRPKSNQFAVFFLDITERKKIESELKKANEELEERVKKRTEQVSFERQRLYAMLETLPVYVALLDNDYRIPFANKVFRDRFGDSRGRRCYEYLFNRDEPCESCETYKVLKTNSPHNWEWLGPDGCNYDIYDLPFVESDGKILILEMGMDITKRKLAELELNKYREHLEELVKEQTEDLRENEKKIRQTMDLLDLVTKGTEVIIASIDIDFHYTYFNEAYKEELKRLTGKDIQIGMSIIEIFASMPRQQKIVLEEWSLPLKGESTNKTIKFGESDIYQRIYNVLHTPIRDSSGKIVGAGEVAIDITDLKKAEEALKWNSRRDEILSQTASVLLESDNPKEVIEKFCLQIMDFLGCHVFINFMADKDINRLHLNSYSGITKEEAAKIEWLDYGEAICGCVALERKRIIASDLLNNNDQRALQVKSYGIQAYCCHPILIQGSLIGTLSFGTRTRPQFKEEEINLMESVTSLVAIAMNRVETERALRENQKDFERAQVVGNIGNWRLDIKQNKLIWSDENYNIFNVPKGTPLTYESFLNMIHPDDRVYVDEKWKKGMQGEDYDIEHRILVEGQIKWVREKAFLEFDDKGSLLAGFGITQDITIRKEFENKLRESEERFRYLAEALPQIVWTAKADGSIDWFNLRWYEFSGKSENSPGGWNWKNFVHPDDLELMLKSWEEAISKGDLFNNEVRIQRYDGEYLWFLIRAWPMHDGNGNVVRWFGTSTDINDLKKAQEILSENKDVFERLVQERTKQLVAVQIELEKAKRLSDIGFLASTVAHELRNPLATISMAVYNIRKKAENPDLNKHLEHIDKKIEESEQIINNLLFYSRLKVPNYENANIKDIIRESIEMLEHKSQKEMKIFKNINSIENITIKADIIQIKEVFNNILNNAYDAISLDRGEIKVSSENENDFVKIVISDNGGGISKNVLDKVFDPFFTTKSKGTGLGLCVCKQIINFHNGTIDIESEEGQGTTVVVRLAKEKKH